MSKKFLPLLVLILLFAVLGAQAESETSVWEVRANDIILNPASGVLAVKSGRNPNYVLMDAAGNTIANTDFSKISIIKSSLPLFEVFSENKIGIINSQGDILVPAEYDKIIFVTEKWQIAVNLSPEGTPEDYDYHTISLGGDSYDIITEADIFFEGVKIGTLSRQDFGKNRYFGSFYYEVFGNYMLILDQNGEYQWYDSEFTALNTSLKSSEYDHEYENGFTVYYHNATGEKAFMAGCSLTEDVVANPYLFENQTVYDLQGNELFVIPYNLSLTTFAFDHGYAASYDSEDKYVIFDDKGNIVFGPTEPYYSIGFDSVLFEQGYVAVCSENKTCGFTDREGNITSDIISFDNDEGAFLWQDSGDIWTPAGKLEGKFSELYKGGILSAIIKDEAGNYGVVSIYGETLVPFSENNYLTDISLDGTIALIKETDGTYKVYSFLISK